MPGTQARERAGEHVETTGRCSKGRCAVSGSPPDFCTPFDAAPGVLEIPLRHADDGVEVVVETHLSTDGPRVAAETPGPQTVADHHDFGIGE